MDEHNIIRAKRNNVNTGRPGFFEISWLCDSWLVILYTTETKGLKFVIDLVGSSMSLSKRYSSTTPLKAIPNSAAMPARHARRNAEFRYAGASFYDKTFRFANSPMQRNARIEKVGSNKRRSLEASRRTRFEQREQYRCLIAQHLIATFKESSALSQRTLKGKKLRENGTKNLEESVIDLTGRNSPENVPGPVFSAEKLRHFQPPKTSTKNSIGELNNMHSETSLKTTEQPDMKNVVLQDSMSPSENFVPNLLKIYGRREQQRGAQTCEAETRARLLQEKKEVKEDLLAEILEEKLKLGEKRLKKAQKLPELTRQMSKTISIALVPCPARQVLAKGFSISITREYMSTLFAQNWLNDEIINIYMELIVQRSKERPDLPSVHAMNTFFYPRLSTQAYNSVRRWTKRVDIFSKDLVFYPIHLGIHWCLAVVDFTEKEIRYYDSMGAPNLACLETLRQYLCSEHKDKKGTDYDTSDWRLLSVENIPQQMNGGDCGVFTCKFAEYISLKQNLNFNQSNMQYFRRAMVWEILSMKLLR